MEDRLANMKIFGRDVHIDPNLPTADCMVFKNPDDSPVKVDGSEFEGYCLTHFWPVFRVGKMWFHRG